MLNYGANPRSLDSPRSVFVSTYAIFFLGTPHEGSELAAWGSIVQSICAAVVPKVILNSAPQLLNALQAKSETLYVIQRDFATIMGEFKMYCFHETRQTNFGGTERYVVEKQSAAPPWPGVSQAGIEKNHSEMCKFENENASGYSILSYKISEFVNNCLQC